jgi:hypothetical protein
VAATCARFALHEPSTTAFRRILALMDGDPDPYENLNRTQSRNSDN